MEGLRGNSLVAAIAMACGCGFALFGYNFPSWRLLIESYDQAIAGGILSGLPFKQQFNNPSQVMQGVITSSYHIGCVFGALLSFFIGDYGRKKCIVRIKSQMPANLDHGKYDNGFRLHRPNKLLWTGSTYCWTCGNWDWKWIEYMCYSNLASGDSSRSQPWRFSKYSKRVTLLDSQI